MESLSLAIAREQLYEEVWAEPMVTVAARYNVSSSYLARVCERMNVPRPARGHWAKLAAGKPSPRKPLPEPRPGDELSWSRDGDPPATYRPVRRNPSRPQRRVKRTALPEHHPLIVGTTKYFERVRETREGYLRPYKRLMVDVFVTRPMVERTLHVANALFKEFEARGHRVTLAPRDELLWRHDFDEREKGGRDRYETQWRPERPTVVYVDGYAFGLTLFELSESIEVRYVNGKYIPVSELTERQSRKWNDRFSWTTHQDRPTGRLCLQAYSPYPNVEWVQQWRERKPGELEGKAATIVRALKSETGTIAALVDKARREAEQREREWEEQKRKREEEADKRRHQLALKESTEELLRIIDAWTDAKRRESFFKEAEEGASRLQEPERSQLLERIRLARDLTRGTDPLTWFQDWKTPEERYPRRQ